ncbi:MAG: cyanate hydratase, partial [Dietzia sp.]
MTPIMSKRDAAAHVDSARIRQGRTWAELADHLGAPLVWTTAALLGNHPMSAGQAASICELLGLGEDVAESLALQPSRGTPAELMSDPTIYRLTEALSVYGPALKALI